LFDIKCAWFNENEYCEFFPRTLLSRDSRQRVADTAQSSQKDLNRSGDSSVYRTVCWMFLWPR